MATISVFRTHQLPLDVLKPRVEELVVSLADMGIQWRWASDYQLKFDAPNGSAKGTTGTVTIGETNVHVGVDLPFLLGMFKGRIQERLEQKLNEVVA